jgi:GGDEF domain-containing protein
VYPRDGDDPERLFHAADEAMYAAKRSGERTHFAA